MDVQVWTGRWWMGAGDERAGGDKISDDTKAECARFITINLTIHLIIWGCQERLSADGVQIPKKTDTKPYIERKI